MRAALQPFLLALLLLVSAPLFVDSQEPTDTQQTGTTGSPRQMRPVLRGREYAVSSMKAEVTAAAVRILEAGGNAIDKELERLKALAERFPALARFRWRTGACCSWTRCRNSAVACWTSTPTRISARTPAWCFQRNGPG